MKKVKIDKESPNFNSIPDMGSMMNGMMGGMPNIPPMDDPNIIDANIVDVEATEITDNNIEVVTEPTPIPPAVLHNDDTPIINIKTATAFYVAFNQNKKDLATVYYLCRDNDDNLFMLDRNIMIEREEDRLMLENLPIVEDEEGFIAQRIAMHSLNAYMDSYMTDLEFYVNDGFEKDLNPVVYTYGVNINTRVKYKFTMSADIFSCINFTDSYIFEGVNCEHDFALAITAGSKVAENPAQFFLVEHIDSIVSMANAKVEKPKKGLSKLFKKKDVDNGTTIGLVVKVNRFIDKDTKETASILTPFDVGVTFDESKYRGKTIDEIQEKYYGDSDQYVATLTTMNTRLFGVDKEYMIIRGKTKDKVLRLFLMDASVQEELKHLIDTY